MLFSQAGPFQGLCALSVLTRHHQGFQSNELGCKEHRPLCVVPDAFLSPLLSTADIPHPLPQSNCCLLEGTESAWGNKFQCLGYCPALSHPSIEFNKTSACLDYLGICCEIEWSRASVFPLEVPKVFCVPNKILVLVVSPFVNVNRETSSRKQSWLCK